VYSYTKELIPNPNTPGQRQRAHYWAALALLRCVMSSPAAAEKALSAHASSRGEGEVLDQDQALSDSDADSLYQDGIYETNPSENPLDVEPSSVFSEATVSTRRIRDFALRAGKLKGKNDPKLQKLAEALKNLLKDDYNPIVYCRYIATAKYLGDELPKLLKEHKIKISVVTGERSEEEREEAINKLEKEPRRLLIATDCMSEGINLQHSFDAVVHYDLPWNPNRLEQREGRIDRYGQSRDNVRAVMLYGENNPIDQAVMKVLVRKARSIYRSLGISVPLPLEDGSVLNAMINELFSAKEKQLTLFDSVPNLQLDMAEELELKWQSIAEREKASRSRFAQLSIKPEEVAKELAEIDQVLGNPDELENFMRISAQRLNFALEPKNPRDPNNKIYRLSINAKTLDPLLAARLRPIFGIKEETKDAKESKNNKEAEQTATLQVSFDPNQLYPKEVELIGRNHPLVSNLAEYLLDQALSTHGKHDLAARSAMIRTNAVTSRTVLLVLRVRLLIKHRGNQSTSLAEELVICGLQNQQTIAQDQAIDLFMHSQPSSNTEQQERLDALKRALERLSDDQLNQIAEQRAEHLRETYNRLSSSLGGSAQIKPHLPPDIWGIYVLMPALH
jgi:superfamily II DNA/RNA helicase